MLLSKGFEVELYTGDSQGQIVGLSEKIVQDLEGFVREPDNRNVEYTTAPFCSYDRLLCALLKPRQRLRAYLESIGKYTIIPGSTLSLGDSDHFYRSDPHNPYHNYIESNYGTKVVTASIHINVGIANPEVLMKACRLIRVEAPLYLALSASSPFLDGKVTGYHSTRWSVFPKTPAYVPLFESHNHYIEWTQEQLAQKTMENVRHLWCSVRPNGDRRPYCLNRLELRICDLVVNPIALLGIMALLEARVTQVIQDSNLDPLTMSKFTHDELIRITDENELAAAKESLDASLTHWLDGRQIKARDWIEEIYQQVLPITKDKGYSCFLSPVKKILREGNQAQQWLQQYHQGLSVREVITQGIQELEQLEQDLEDKLCGPLLVA